MILTKEMYVTLHQRGVLSFTLKRRIVSTLKRRIVFYNEVQHYTVLLISTDVFSAEESLGRVIQIRREHTAASTAEKCA